jgi:hypothetical protein
MKFLEFANKALEAALIESVEVAECKAVIIDSLGTPLIHNCCDLSIVRIGIGRAIYNAIQASAMEQMNDCAAPDICTMPEPKCYTSFGTSSDYIYTAITECCSDDFESVVGNLYHTIKQADIDLERCLSETINFIGEV